MKVNRRDTLEIAIPAFIAFMFVISLFFGIRNSRNYKQQYDSLKQNLMDKYSLSESKGFSVQDSRGRQVRFSTYTRKVHMPGEIFGSDSIKNPSFAGVSCVLDAPGLFEFEFMMMNNNTGTRRTSYFPFRPVKSAILSEAVKEQFHMVSNTKGLQAHQVSALQQVALSLTEILEDQIRYTISFRDEKLTIYVGVHSIKTLEDLDSAYKIVMQCVDVLTDDPGTQSLAA